MADQTKVEIRDRVGAELGIVRGGQGMQDQDKVRIEQGYDEVYAELEEEGIAAWAATDVVPDHYAQPMVFLVALNCAGEFGISDARLARIAAQAGMDGNLAKRKIRKFIRPPYEGAELPQDY